MKIKTYRKIEEEIEIKVEDIVCVYTGQANSCMCGCSGTYYYSSLHTEYASKDRGYEIEKGEIDDQKIKDIFNNICSTYHKIENIDNYIFTVSAFGHQLTIYLKKENKMNNTYRIQEIDGNKAIGFGLGKHFVYTASVPVIRERLEKSQLQADARFEFFDIASEAYDYFTSI